MILGPAQTGGVGVLKIILTFNRYSELFPKTGFSRVGVIQT